MGDMLWKNYVLEVAGNEQQAEVARKSGVNQGTVSRWRHGKKVPIVPAVVAEFCRSYGRNPLEGFVAAGMIVEDEAGRALTKASRDLLARLRAGDDSPLVDQMRRAVRRGRSSPPEVFLADEDDAG